MAKFFDIRVVEVYKETKDTSVVTFEIPDDLKETFAFTQGQHLTLRADINGKDERRSYSLCSSPLDGIWRVAVKQIPGGVFSTYVNESLKAGDTIQLMPPSGRFFVPISDTPKNYIAFAAGSGITPILSIIKTHLAQEPDSSFKLFFLNRTVKSIIFKEEIEALKNQYFDRFEIFYFLTKERRDIPLFNGRFDEEKMQALTKTFIDVPDTHGCFICGPQEMIFLIRDALQDQGMDLENIHYELFYTGDAPAPAVELKEVQEGTEVVIIDGGKEFRFVMEDEHDNILDAALAAGADLPYACKGGVCSTCKCKVLSGEVAMKINYALEADEVAQDFVLSCQAVPQSDKVTVDFDV